MSAEEHGDESASHSVPSSTTDPSTIVETNTSVASSPASVKIESEHSERKGRKPGTSARTTTMVTTSKPANGHATRSDTNSSGNTHSNNNRNKGHPTLQEGKSEPISTTTKTLNQLESPQKDSKSEAGDIPSQPSTLEKHETEARRDEAVDVESIAKDVSEPLITDVAAEQATQDTIPDDGLDASNTSTKRSPGNAGNSARQKKQTKAPSTTGSSTQARTVNDPPAAKPSPKLVVDKNQKSRKWDRPSIMIQTLGGAMYLPLWVSDQEMLLNEPRPYFMQRSYPVPSSSSHTGPTTNLARMAVLNQTDINYGYDSPERGTTPESRESSPAPPSLPLVKKKNKKSMFGKQERPDSHHSANADSVVAIAPSTSSASSTFAAGVKRKRTFPAAPGSSTGGGDEEVGESTTRPALAPMPTSRPRAVPTRPRMYPCSFEGCTKSFMDFFHLKRHETRHVTQMITCGIDGCTKAYDSMSTMRRHQSMMHKEWKQEMAAASAAAAATFSIPSSGHDAKRMKLESGKPNEEGVDEGENSATSPTPSSTTYTAVSSPPNSLFLKLETMQRKPFALLSALMASVVGSQAVPLVKMDAPAPGAIIQSAVSDPIPTSSNPAPLVKKTSTSGRLLEM
ncbi:hypothetical protein BGX34_001395 [Mortierella sp. NVP85]|nr:hypothetical protein BGX34_001395 [Mortierella sp. NVP85]